jgi:hypothetical protein
MWLVDIFQRLIIDLIKPVSSRTMTISEPQCNEIETSETYYTYMESIMKTRAI